MRRIAVDAGIELACEIDDFLWPWTQAVSVFMVHGHARSTRFWDRWVPAVARTHRVHRLDLRGCGRSDLPPEGYRFETTGILADVAAVLDELGLDRVHWVGESSSGVLGLAFAALHPERIASPVLCDTPYRIPDDLKPLHALGHGSTADAIEALGTREWCRRTLQNRLDLERANPALQAWYVDEMGKTRPDVAASYNRCFEAADLRPVLEEAAAPTLLFGGDRSGIAAAQLETLRSSIPNARARPFRGFGHGVSVLAPETCAREAVAFWGTL